MTTSAITTASTTGAANRAIRLYLDLMKRVVSNTIYQDPDIDIYHLIDLVYQAGGNTSQLRTDGPVKTVEYTAESREQGRMWPRDAHTMVGMQRLDNLQQCVERVIADGVPGDLIETGVWRGGVCIFMRAILAAYGVNDRTVWVADSFEGIPAPNPEQYPADGSISGIGFYNEMGLSVSLEAVQENFRRYGLLDDQVSFLKGYFRDTLPTAPVERLAILRLDGDLYESTMDALVNLYPKLSPGGFLIVDDYVPLEICAKAVHDYRNAHGITEPIEQADWSAVYWRKS